MTCWDRSTPWRQGSVLSAEAVVGLGLANESEKDMVLAVAISHDCDIANSAEQEPSIEFILATPRTEAVPQFLNAKNARRLHLNFTRSGDVVAVELLATKKVNVPKAALAGCMPDATFALNAAGRYALQRWLGARYMRAAFSDKFEELLRQRDVVGKISRAVEQRSRYLEGLWFDVDDCDNGQAGGTDSPCSLQISVVYSVREDVDKAREEAEATVLRLRGIFKAAYFVEAEGQASRWEGIELADVRALASDEFTLEDLIIYRQWRLEDLSLKAEPPQQLPTF